MEPPRLPLSVSLKPPFLRPELLERAAPLKVKLSDNGLKAGLGRSKVGAWAGMGEGMGVRPPEWGRRQAGGASQGTEMPGWAPCLAGGDQKRWKWKGLGKYST